MERDEKTTTPVISAATTDLGEKLINAGKIAEQQQAERRQREVKGSHLTATFMERVAAVSTLSVAEKTGFNKVTGSAKGKAVYVAKKGGRVDLSGFEVGGAVKLITEQQAQEMHLGRVRGQLDFGKPDAEVLASFDAALVQLDVALPPAPKKAKPAGEQKPKAERKPKAPKAAPVVSTNEAASGTTTGAPAAEA